MPHPQLQILILILIIASAACTVPPTATVPPSPLPVRVSFSPYLEPIREAIHTCAVSIPGIALIVNVVPQNSPDFTTSDITIWWGDKPEEVDQSFQIADESLVVIIHPDNLNSELSTSELQGFFSGRVERWTDISIMDEEVAVWVYPPDSSAGEIFRQVLLGDGNYSRLAFIAPSPGPMLEEVSADPGAIGVVPRAWLSAEVAQVNIDPQLNADLNQPILALVNSEPQSGVRALLACLQSGAGQPLLASRYPPQDK